MREILFKAKRKDTGEWVEGCFLEKIDLLLGVKKHFILNQKDANSSFDWHNVDPETLCQYTGLTDKNGRKVFDGDLVKCFYEDVVNGGSISETHICDMENYYCMLRIISACYIEVIGNIHDEED